MSTAIKSAIAGALAALMLAVVPQAQADHDDYRHGKHGWKHGHHYRHWGHHRDRVVVIREPRYVYRERAYVVEEPYYYPARRPSVVLGVNVPPLVIGF